MTLAELNQTLFGSADQRVMLTRMGIVITVVLGLVALVSWLRTRRDILAGWRLA